MHGCTPSQLDAPFLDQPQDASTAKPLESELPS